MPTRALPPEIPSNPPPPGAGGESRAGVLGRLTFGGLALRLLALALVPGAAACSDRSSPRPWTLPVPEDARRIILHDIPAGARPGNPMRLVREMAIGPRGDDADYLFGTLPPDVAVDDSGRVWVLDRGNRRLLVYGADGEHLRTIGGPGEGPGEIGQAVELWLQDGILHVRDPLGSRVVRWSVEGELLDNLKGWELGGRIVPLDDGGLVWRRSVRSATGRDLIFERVDASGEPLVQYARLPWPERVIDPPRGTVSGTESNAFWAGIVSSSFAATRAGEVYIGTFDEYQIFAYGPDGAMRWALQVDHERPPLSRVEIEHHMAEHRSRFPERLESQVDWPERQYALGDIRVDGHGHVWVFPYVPRGTPPGEPLPVDVYSADGERLWSGQLTGPPFGTLYGTYNGAMLEVVWQVTRGDRVWGVDTTAAGEFEVVRFRLEEPF